MAPSHASASPVRTQSLGEPGKPAESGAIFSIFRLLGPRRERARLATRLSLDVQDSRTAARGPRIFDRPDHRRSAGPPHVDSRKRFVAADLAHLGMWCRKSVAEPVSFPSLRERRQQNALSSK